MRYVLDSCIGLKWGLPESDSLQALRLREDFRNAVHQLIAPDIFPIEVGHALTRAERQRRIVPGDGWKLWKKIMADCPVLFSATVLMPRAIELSSKMRIGLYDCLYVALAERENCELVTADERLANSLQGFPVVSLDHL